MTVDRAGVLLFLRGILIGMLFVALIIAGGISLNAATFLFVLLLLYFVIAITGAAINLLLLIGLLIGALLAFFVREVSPGSVMDAGLLALSLIVLVVR